jgi:uncharacterized integral membrane protein
MRKVKLIAIVLIAILTIVILVQNTEPVQARILFRPVTMSLALLMVLAFVLGFTIGILVATYLLKRKKSTGKPGSAPGR